MDDKIVTDPKTFTVIRKNDESHVSGTGRVLDGVLFPNGKVVVCWRVKYQTIAVYESFEAFKAIHIDSHPTNQTEIIWTSGIKIYQIMPPPRLRMSIISLSRIFGS